MSNELCLQEKFPVGIWKNIKHESRETKYLEANLFNQIHNVVII